MLTLYVFSRHHFIVAPHPKKERTEWPLHCCTASKGGQIEPLHCLHCTQKVVQVGHSIACTAPKRPCKLAIPLLALHPKGRASWPFHCLPCTQKAVQVGHSIACTAPKRPCKLAIPLLYCVWRTGIIGNPSQENETMMRGNLGHPKMHKTEASVWGVHAISKIYGLFFYEGEWFSKWCSTNKKFQWPNGTYSKQSTLQHF